MTLCRADDPDQKSKSEKARQLYGAKAIVTDLHDGSVLQPIDPTADIGLPITQFASGASGE